MTPLQLMLISLIITLITLLYRKKRKSHSGHYPPAPPGLPVLGNLHQLGSLPHRSLALLAKSYGPLMRLHLGDKPVFIVSSAELAEEVAKTQDAIFASRPKLSIPKKLLYGPSDIAFSPSSPHWRDMKKLCSVHLLSLKRVQSFRAIREEEIALLLSNIRSASTAPIDLSLMIATITNDIVCRVALGKKYSEHEGFYEVLKENITLLGTFPVKDYVPCLGWFDELSGLNARVRKNFRKVDGFLEQLLNEHLLVGFKNVDDESEEEQKTIDIIDVLLSLKEKNGSDGKIAIGRDIIKAITWDMFAGGTSTTASVIEWAMTNLLANPSKMRKAQGEIRRISGSKSIVSEEILDRMGYLKAIIKETIRLHTPVPLLLRQAQQNSILSGYNVSAGTTIFINAWMIGRDPKIWIRPEEFIPERFFNNNIDYKGKDFHYLPFGAGRRICPGMAFGVLTAQLVLANLLHSFDWEIPEERKVEVLDMTELFGVTVQKKFGLYLIAKPHTQE